MINSPYYLAKYVFKKTVHALTLDPFYIKNFYKYDSGGKNKYYGSKDQRENIPYRIFYSFVLYLIILRGAYNLIKSKELLIGDVGCTPTTLSKTNCFSICFTACSQATSDEALSFEIFEFLFIIFAPSFEAYFKILLESLLTQVLEIFFDFNDALIDQKINGLPPTFFKFLFLIPFDPPLAKIIECVFI